MVTAKLRLIDLILKYEKVKPDFIGSGTGFDEINRIDMGSKFEKEWQFYESENGISTFYDCNSNPLYTRRLYIKKGVKLSDCVEVVNFMIWDWTK